MLKICFVCTGNTCRSVMAERIAKGLVEEKNLKNIKIFSKGLNALGDNISPNAKLALKKLGYNSRNRKSVKLKKFEKDMLYVTMTYSQRDYIKPFAKTICLGDFDNQNEVIDPYGYEFDVYLQTAEKLVILINKLLDKINLIRS